MKRSEEDAAGGAYARILERMADDLREAGLLVLVFLIVDYIVPGSAADRRIILEWAAVSGLSSLMLGYLIEWRRKP